MKIAKNIKELNIYSGTNQVIGFVPTMGSLHEGHFLLVKEAILETSLTVVSIFVNPTQFNDSNDLKNYPRNIENDLFRLNLILREKDIVFIPDEKEIYPKPDTRTYNFGHLDKIMEGRNRPGHFNGVGQVVSKLFQIVKPSYAFFGEKDLQQLAVVRKLVQMLKIPIIIIGIPIVREADGLAMSSRNQLLGKNERAEVPKIFKALTEATRLKGINTVDEVRYKTIKEINKSQLLFVEYFEIVDEINLLPIKNWDINTGIFGCIAVKVGKIRVIDNIRF
ncbi:MAG: pantoate--beta-alanine ligase [Bacteroidales bacterium]|nr:pantoate--beta-alanine ligase [Bacteroidales bacterium]